MNDPGALFFILMAGLAGTMTLIYFPLRIFLTATARSRRLKLLQRIRKLRDELGQPIRNWLLNTCLSGISGKDLEAKFNFWLQEWRISLNLSEKWFTEKI